MISKKNYDVKLLDELHDVIKTKFGFNLIFTEKAMNQGYTTEQIQASQKPISEQVEFLVDEGVFNDLEAARLVFKLYPHWVCCHSELYVFDDKTGLWSNEEQAHMQIISKFDKYLYLMMPTKDGDCKKGTKGYGNSTTLQRQMIPQLKILCINNDWLKDSENTSLKKLLFLDGYLDLVTGIFFEIYNPKIVFMNRIQQRYQNKSVDESYIEDLKQRLFNNPLGSEVGNYFLLSIARGLAGDVMKKIVFGLGGTNGGKSTITKACVNSFGEYVSSFNAENLSYNKSSTDEAAKLRWAMLLRFKRLIFSNEIKNTVELNGNDIKKISSGGDTLIGRIHGGLECQFTPHFLAIVLANDIPKITPYDDAVNNRINVVSFSKQFVDEPSNEFELKKDENLEEEMRTDKFRYHFMKLVINRYLQYIREGKKDIVPLEITNAKVEWIGDDTDFNIISKFEETFEITNNPLHYIESGDIQIWLDAQKVGISFKKFSVEFKKYCIVKKFISVESKNKKINGRVAKVWTGVSNISTEENANTLGVQH